MGPGRVWRGMTPRSLLADAGLPRAAATDSASTAHRHGRYRSTPLAGGDANAVDPALGAPTSSRPSPRAAGSITDARDPRGGAGLRRRGLVAPDVLRRARSSSEVRTPAARRALPDGSLKDFSGLDGFIVLNVRRAGTDKKLVHRTLDACLSSTGERIDPAAAATLAVPALVPVEPLHRRLGHGRAEGLGVQHLRVAPASGRCRSAPARTSWRATGRAAVLAGLRPDRRDRDH